jgi:hypothetical protein
MTKCRWARLLRICFSSMLLLEDVIWANNMILNLCYCKHFKAFLFSLIKFWTQYCNIISTTNSVYVICICLIKYDLGCEVDLSRPSWYSTDYRVYISDGMHMSTCLMRQSYLILYKLGTSVIGPLLCMGAWGSDSQRDPMHGRIWMADRSLQHN